LSSESSLIIIECSRITAKSLWVWSNLVLEIVTYPAYKQLLDEVFVISRIIEIEVEVISRSRRLRLITLTETITSKTPNLIIVLLYIERKKLKSCLCSLTSWRQAEQSARTWHDCPKKSCTAVIHNMITRDLECLWHDYCIICSYDVTGADFENSPYACGQSEKRQRVQCIIIWLISRSNIIG